MIEAPKPQDEDARLAALQSLNILDTAPEPLGDAIVEALAGCFDAPIAAITMVDADRQWFKASAGLTVTQTPRAVSFCAYTVLLNRTLVVSDTKEDARFFDNPLVTGSPDIRFYAGVPIRIDGQAVGALCVIDRVAQAPDKEALERLEVLGLAVEAWLAAGSCLGQVDSASQLIQSLRSLSRRTSCTV